jgi:sucrose-phosphate synthase
MKVIPPGLDFSSLKVTMPEDPTLREFEQARALQEMLEKPQPLSPRPAASGAASPRAASETAGGPGAAAPPTPALSAGGGAGQQSPRGDSSSGGELAAPSPRAEMVMDPLAGPPIWKVSGRTAPAAAQYVVRRGGSFARVPTACVGLRPSPAPPRPPCAGAGRPRCSARHPLPPGQEISRFLRNPLKPAILAMSRPDPKKNITTLVEAFGRHSMLRELANLVLIMVGGQGGVRGGGEGGEPRSAPTWGHDRRGLCGPLPVTRLSS